ncbi:MAG TPA: hypothetical protein VGF49_08325, partial [Candidatus Solibacter sp.]
VCLPRLNSAPEYMPAADRPEEVPPLCERWLPAPSADPVASFIRPSAALDPAALATRLPVVLEFPLGRRIPITAAAVAAPAPEPVAEFVRLSAAAIPAPVMVRALRPAAALQIPAWQQALPVAGHTQAPAAEPVEEFLRLSAALAPVETATPALKVVPFNLSATVVEPSPVGGTAAPAPEPVAAFLHWSTSLTPAAASPAPIRLQQLRIAVEIEPLPVPDEPLEIPAICLRAMPSPAPEPVCRFVTAASQGFLAPPLSVAPPLFALEIEHPYIPRVLEQKPAAPAEPVMSGVYPRTADIPIAPIAAATLLMLPAVATLADENLALAAPAPTLPAEPAEILLVASAAAVPVASAAECRIPRTAAFANPAPAPELAAAASGPQPAPLESMLVSATAETQSAPPQLHVLDFIVTPSRDLKSPGFDAPRLAPKVSQPRPGSHKVIPLQPIAMLTVSAPVQQHQRILPTLPQPGMLPVEFHAQRSRGVLFERPEWQASRVPAIPPHFALRPLFGKLEEPTPQPKPVRQEPEFIKSFQSARKPSQTVLLGGKIAAALLLASSLWYAYSFRGRTRGVEIAAAENASISRGTTAVSTDSLPPAPAAAGSVAWVRQSLARRAAIEITDHFREGMQGWGASTAATPAPPAGWSHHRDGYTVPGALALFRPSLNFKDYRLEFFGQIENKGMAWSVRSKDPNNYHAMKVAVVEAGLRPFVALVHWDVINGKAGHQSRTPLNIMVHNNRPMQVAVNVEGDHLVTSIDGEEVDTFTNETLRSGGIGFFAEANERARLYWVRVSRNDDFLGHVCAFLAGDDAVRATAELRTPEFPGGTPTPWAPADDSTTTFAAVWAGLPYLRAAQKARASHTRRTDQWNT